MEAQASRPVLFICCIIFIICYVNVCRKKDSHILAILIILCIFAGRLIY